MFCLPFIMAIFRNFGQAISKDFVHHFKVLFLEYYVLAPHLWDPGSPSLYSFDRSLNACPLLFCCIHVPQGPLIIPFWPMKALWIFSYLYNRIMFPRGENTLLNGGNETLCQCQKNFSTSFTASFFFHKRENLALFCSSRIPRRSSFNFSQKN